MKPLSIAALVMVGMLACVKETPQETTPEEAPGVKVTLSTTVSLAEDTKALTPTGVKTFAKNEQIAVVYKNTSGNTVKATSVALTDGDITNEGHSAQFTVTLTDPDREQNVTYIYPAAMAKDNGEPNWEALASQDGTLATLASQLDYAKYTGAWTAGALPTGTLDNQLAILALTLKSSDGASVITDEIGRLMLNDGTHSYFVTRTPAEGPIYIAIHPTASANVQLVAQSATRFYTKSLTGKTYEASNGYSLSFRMAALPEGALPGKFTVDGGKEVYFAKGNLQHVGSSWRFAASQWEYYGMAQSPGNDMFSYNGWSSASSLVSDGWGVLSKDEWNTLINTRTVSNTLHTDARYTLATLGSYKGLIVFPDHYVHPEGTGFTAGTYNGASNFTATVSMEGWAKMEMAGCMFIPAAGYKSYTNGWQAVGSAVCVSSTTQNGSGYYYTPYFADGNVNMSDNSHTGTWSSVRMYKGTAPVTGIALNKTATSIPVGSTETLTATVTPSGAANPGVSWTSNNSSVATVDAATGEITAVAKGTATITATALDGSGVTATCTATIIQEGALTGQFSVSGTKKVYFSRGNLQAVFASAGSSCTWQFAEHQWDYIGINTANNKINGNGSVSAAGTVDLFGWSTNATYYGIHNSKENGTYNGSFKDWGTNAITNGGNTANSWRTPTNDEWTYFMETRPGATVGATANARYTAATINTDVSGGVNGRIMFPDGVTFATDEATTWGTINANSNWTTKCTAAQWTALETKGCVFMPAAGYRTGIEGGGAGDRGRYWLATVIDSYSAYSSFFGIASGTAANDYYRRFGRSVRLVYNAN